MMEVVVAALLLFIGWLEWHNGRERRYLINCLIARNPHEARLLNQIAPPPVPVRTPDTFWDEDELDGFEGPVGL